MSFVKEDWTDDSSSDENGGITKNFKNHRRIIPDSDESEDDSVVASEGIIFETDDEDEDILSVSMQNTKLDDSPKNNRIIQDSSPDSNVSKSSSRSNSRKTGDNVKKTPDLKAITPKKSSTPKVVISPSKIFTPQAKFLPNKSTEWRTPKPQSDDDEEEDASSASSASTPESPSPEKSLEVINDSFKENEIVEISSSDDETPTVNTTKIPAKPLEEVKSNKRRVPYSEYQKQVERVRDLEQQYLRAENTTRVINLNTLPDKGKMIIDRHRTLGEFLQKAKEVLNNMEVMSPPPGSAPSIKKEIVSWEDIQAGVKHVQPQTFGKVGIAKFETQKTMSIERLEQLHGSLKNCPTDQDLAENPKNLKIDLMPHQKRALKWLLWREESKPSGGILADDMGLGKTLTMISLISASLEKEEENDDESSDEDENNDDEIAKKCDYKGGTLVICPASIINQWMEEIKNRTKRGSLSVDLHHGAKRETRAKPLSRTNIVLTTYSLIKNDLGLFKRIKWRRIILDEAHQIRNYKSITAKAIFELPGKSRWALTGTPVNNKELDLYALLKFLRCSPFDNLAVWKHWVANKSTGGQERLNTVISSLMLRRTKAELIERGALNSMPEKKWELIRVQLDPNESKIYQKVLLFSKTLLGQFLHQRAMKNEERYESNYEAPNKEYFKMIDKFKKINKYKEIKQHEILVLLLRLRQICCHPHLISQMLNGDEDLGNADSTDEIEELDLIDQLNNLDLDEDKVVDTSTDNIQPSNIITEGAVSLKEASKGVFNLSNPIFSAKTRTSKLKKCFELLDNILERDDKVVMVSQWSSLLTLIGNHLKDDGVKFDQLDGSIPVNKRQPIIENFNNQNHPMKVLLLSLTAGGVGLNLVGGNHLILLDLHWNPQLERQAQDRVYRVGQKKPVFIYKIMVENTIEERIYALQQNKLEIAESITQGSKTSGANKLSLQDLKMLFDM